MEALRDPPNAAEFTPLAEHRAATPASFYTGPPVLHYHSDRSKVLILEREVAGNAVLEPLLQHAQAAGEPQPNGHDQSSDAQKVLEEVDVWVTSQKLYLFSPGAKAGLSIPYPTISLHAIQTLPSPASESNTPTTLPSQGVYMQLLTTPLDTASEEDTEPESISLTIIPTASAPPQGPGSATAPTTVDAGEEVETEDQPEQTPAQALFAALSACADLHPDPVEDDDDMEDGEGVGSSRLVQAGLAIPLSGEGDDGLPPPMPGSGGWITAENMHEFVDENGNFIEDDAEEVMEGDAALGPGAGTVHSREDEADGDDETKWQKTG